jgi:prepilin-type N-terminal cleavage/methylation domain-containing protein
MTDLRIQTACRPIFSGGLSVRKAPCGYSLIEVLVAAVIVAMGIAAAAVLAMTMVSQQETSAKVVRALNYQEQACRLFQLDVAPAEIIKILPTESSVTSLTFGVTDVTVTDVGRVKMATCTNVITTSGFGSSATRTNVMAVIRPNTWW